MNAAIIVAGGDGVRTGIDGGKQLALVAGIPVLQHTIAAFDACSAVDGIVVVVHPDRVAEYRERAVAPVASPKVISVVGGGASRPESVAAGLDAVPLEAEVIVVHDGARPLVAPAIIADAIALLREAPECDGVVVGHPSFDTLKTVDDAGWVAHTLDRSRVWAVQTPQVFTSEALRSAYARAAEAGFTGTDDASFVERIGGRVRLMLGPRDNIKITAPEDLLLVERILISRAGDSR